ncbi:MAG TPA: peptidoglycan-binding domain-containing protein [Bryobacteraceae bacterium]|nr:peptidoglycan-binding domain-containing protein [Bryobacteraceae bacterium]
MKTALFLFCITLLAGSLALPQATTPSTTTPKTAPKKAASTSTTKAPPAAVHKTVAGSSKAGTSSKAGPARAGTSSSKSGPGSTTKSATKAGPRTAAKSSSKTGKSGKKTAVATRSRGQLAPTPDRYRDIQTALIAKGYLHEEPTGVWDSDTSDAMRRFQTDQKLPPTGKITAAALIGLGLGPKPVDDLPLAPNATVPAPGASAPLGSEPPVPVTPPAEPPSGSTPH